MNKIQISICIPTFNRDKLLAETIESVIDQIDEYNSSKVEICVSDNDSTDETDQVISEIKKRTQARIVYVKNDRNIGFDQNVMRVVAMASGKYCWLMGSDDIALPGSLNFFLQETNTDHDIYLCNRIDCDIRLNPKGKRFWLDEKHGSEIYEFSNPVEFEKYSYRAKSIGALYSFISSLVFKRDKWMSINPPSVYLECGYIHVFMLLSFIRTGCTLKYCSEHLVLARADADQDWIPPDEWIVKRILLDIDGYQLMADELRSLSEKYFQGVLRVLRAERHGFSNLKILRLRALEMDWPIIADKFRKAGYSPMLISFMGKTKPLFVFLKYLSAVIKRKKRA